MKSKYTDTEKYQWLKTHCVGMKRGDREGPDCPILHFYWDIWDHDKFKWDQKYYDLDKYLEEAMSATV